jgi:protein-disulfide isomerase
VEEGKMLYICELKRRRQLLVLAGASLLILLFFAFACDKTITAGETDDTSFPTYGSGKINVRIYTDYFCPPCQAAEPDLEALLEKLVKQGVIRVSFIDTPIHREAILQIRYFHYSLKKNNSFENTLYVRRVLFETAKQKITKEENLAAYLKSKKISYTVSDIKPALARINSYIANENINSTPTCVIEKDGKTEKLTGGADIIAALKVLK